MLKMDANLVGASRMQSGFDRRGVLEEFEHTVRGPGFAAITCRHSHPLSVRGMARDCRVDFSGGFRHSATYERLINLHHGALGKLRSQTQVGGIIFGDDEAAARILVQTMDDAGPCHAANPAEFPLTMEQNGVHDSMLAVASTRMDHHSRRFVEHEKVFVLVQNIKGQVLGQHFGRFGFGPMHVNLFPRMRMMRWADHLTINANMTFFNQSLNRSSGDSRKLASQKGIKTLHWEGLFDGDQFVPRSHDRVLAFKFKQRGNHPADGSIIAKGE